MIRIISIFFIILSIIFITSKESIAAFDSDSNYDIIVSENGLFSSIQEAIDKANNSDIILISEGTYIENIVINKAITIIGENKTNTIISGRNAGNVIKINAYNVSIQNVTIQQSGKIYPNSGINISSSNAIIKDNIIKNNFYGMTLFNAHHNLIENNRIFENNHCGIYMSNASHNIIINNIVTNHTYNGFGIYDSSDYNVIKNNSLMRNNYCAINLRISSNNIIENNTLRDNNIGIHIPPTENIIKDNIFSNNKKRFDEENIAPGFGYILLIFALLIIIIKKRIV